VIKQVLATKRLVRLITEDKITEDARVWLFDRWPPEENRLTYLLTCERCLSVWAGFAVAGLLPKVLVDTLALSEATILAGEGAKRWLFET
jgi:hypothetical protein